MLGHVADKLVERDAPTLLVRQAGRRCREVLLMEAHFGLVVALAELDGDQRGGSERAIGAHPGMREGEPLGFTNLAIDADLGLHRAGVVVADGHAPRPALAQVELARHHGEAAWHPPMTHPIGLDEGSEYELARRAQRARQGERTGGGKRLTWLCDHDPFPFAPAPSADRPRAGRGVRPRIADSSSPSPKPRAAVRPAADRAGAGRRGRARSVRRAPAPSDAWKSQAGSCRKAGPARPPPSRRAPAAPEWRAASGRRVPRA